MKSLRLLLAALAVIGCFTGCFQMEKVVKLKADGSGTIEETMIITKAALAGFQQMASGFDGGKTGAKVPDIFDEAQLKAAAEKMGEGVTFVSAKKIGSDLGDGFAVIYAFNDINKVKLDQNPGDALPKGGGHMKASASKKEPILFHFTKGSPAEVVLTMPAQDAKPKKNDAPPGMEDMAMQMMKQLLKDMRVSVAIEVEGTISETNAEYHDGSRVTLMDMDFNKVLGDPEKFKALAKANPQTLQESKALVKGLDGVEIETAPEVTIKFQ